MDDRRTISGRAALASHRLVGWIYWDPVGIAGYEALGVPDGAGYYIATRGAPLGAAGADVVAAAFCSTHPDFVRLGIELCEQHTTFEAAAGARDAAVRAGLEAYAPDVCDGLAALGDRLWAVADALPLSGRVLFAAHRRWPRPDDPLVSAWLAVNCLREWRGDTHWAIQIADGISGTAAGVLDGAWRAYDDDWLPRSRGADDAAIDAAIDELGARGFITDGAVNAAGVAHRQALEDRLDDRTAITWDLLGEEATAAFLDLVEPVGPALMARVDATAGPKWMPAGRDRPPRASG